MSIDQIIGILLITVIFMIIVTAIYVGYVLFVARNKHYSSYKTKQEIIFPLFCNICKREIINDMFYFQHPKHGFVCEYCPQFNDGDIKVI